MTEPEVFVHTVSEACRLVPSSSRWNSIELDFNLLPPSSNYDCASPHFSKSYHFNLTITDKKTFKRFLYASASLVIVIVAIVLLVKLLPHKHHHHGHSRNFTIPVRQALSFFDAQKSGNFPKNSEVKFRGDSGLQDGNTTGTNYVNLIGGYYDSGNNIKFTFPTAHTITLLSWSVIEYHHKYSNIGELDHVMDIIKWGTDYLLKVGSASNSTTTDNDINCWQRPEDMSYPRPVSVCRDTASDLAGELVAALSAASIVFKVQTAYSLQLMKAAEELFGLVTRENLKQGVYTLDNACGGEAGQFYNSSGYLDELVWGATWLYFATGNNSHLQYATDTFQLALTAEQDVDKGVYDWNNKLLANAVLLTRLMYFHDPGNPYEGALETSADMTNSFVCSFISQQNFTRTPGGLILLRPSAPLQYTVTTSFLSKLYNDYLYAMRSPGVYCGNMDISLDILQNFSMSQARNNPKKMSYLVGFGEDSFPSQVHHRAASIRWDNQQHSCEEGKKWLNSKDPNPNVLMGAMVAGPDQDDNFIDSRDRPEYTEPTISGNAGLVAALIALHVPVHSSSRLKNIDGTGLDQIGIFDNI
ncbi:hypothetical protein IFM89_013380 [Coptis chinensis]|uniref:cellulase n=1 Tax=Coptis chinensis TaxID=261450 RepID=A0A835I258_9MAGN|nr:hypothetical protein IFM89_013380 [Coptis chinensis]